MFKIKAPDGSNNLCGKNIAKIRKEQKFHTPPCRKNAAFRL